MKDNDKTMVETVEAPLDGQEKIKAAAVAAQEDVLEVNVMSQAKTDDPTQPWHPRMILLYLFCVVGFLNSTMNGYDGSLMNALLANDKFKEFFGASNVGIKAGILSGMYQIGGVVALPFVGPCIDTWGRRVGMLIGGSIIILGTIISGTTSLNENLGQFLAGRFFLGFGVSISAAAGPMYVVELAHPAYRGVLTGLYNVCYFTGSITCSICTRFSLPLSGPTRSWVVPIWVQMVAPGIVVLTCMFLPESPRWLYVNGKQDKAKETIAKYHGLGDPQSSWVQLQIAEYEQFLQLNGSDKRWWDYRCLFRSRSALYRVGCNVTVSIFGQWAGNGVVSYFLSGLLDTAGYTDPTTQLNINLALNCVQFAFAVFGANMVDYWGRRPMLVVVNALLSLCWVAVTASTGVFSKDPNNSAAAKTAVGFVFIFDIVYSVGWTPLQALYPVEVLSFEMRAKGMAFSSLAVNAGGLLNQFAIPVALERIEWKTYIVYIVWCFCQSVILYFLIPETRGFTLEELDEIFKAPYPVRASTKHRHLLAPGDDEKEDGADV